MSAQDFLALGLLSLLVLSVYWLGREIGKHQQRELWRDHMEKCNRYVYAVDDLDKWCGHQSPHARLIARHLRELAAYRLTVENLEREIAAQHPAQPTTSAGSGKGE